MNEIWERDLVHLNFCIMQTHTYLSWISDDIRLEFARQTSCWWVVCAFTRITLETPTYRWDRKTETGHRLPNKPHNHKYRRRPCISPETSRQIYSRQSWHAGICDLIHWRWWRGLVPDYCNQIHFLYISLYKNTYNVRVLL